MRYLIHHLRMFCRMVCSVSRILDHAQRLAQRSIICSLKIFGGTPGSKASGGLVELCSWLETSENWAFFGAGVDLSLMLATEPNASRLNTGIVGRRQPSQLSSKVARAACCQRVVLRSIRARPLLKLSESHNREDRPSGSPSALKASGARRTARQVDSLARNLVNGRPEAVSERSS